jgi:DNA-binding CsgD family transcriptional regulator
VIGFDAHVWLLTDPETSVGASPLAHVPCVPELPELIRLKYATRLNRWTELGDPPVGLLHQATEGELRRSLVWRDLLSRYDVRDVASVVMRDHFGCWAFLDLWRSGKHQPFTPDEAAFLEAIAGPVTSALRRSQASTFSSSPTADSRRLGPVVLLLAPDLTVRLQTPETHAFLHLLVPPSPGAAPIPASAYNVAAQLLAVEAGVDTHAASARVHLAGGLWMTLRAARIGDAAQAQRRDIAVTIEETSPTDRTRLFSRAFGLTGRESELVSHLVEGADTHEIARRMFLSEHTVQDHLKSIFRKTAARNRRTLLARCLGT